MSWIAGVEYELIAVVDLAELHHRDIELTNRFTALKRQHTITVADLDAAITGGDQAIAHLRAVLAVVARHVDYSSAPEQQAVRAAREWVEAQS